MDIIGFLPPSSELNASSFNEWNDDKESVRLCLAVAHSVHGELGERRVEGRSDINYIIQASKKCEDMSGLLEVTTDASYVGTQSPDLIRALMEELRPRTSYSVASVSDGLFDLRGFCYVLGVAAAAGSNNAEFNYDRGLAAVKLLAPSWSVPVAGQLTVGPGVAVTSREFVTLSYLAYAGGIRNLQLMADLLPDRTARPLQGTDLAGFALKVFNNVLCVAQSCVCAGHHMEAFFRGMTYSWSLWGHTDEAGWIRKALSAASYPPGAGIVAVTTEEFMSLPLRRRIAGEDATRICVGLYLTFAGMVSVADCWSTGVPTVFERDEGTDGRPGDFEGLHHRTYEVMERWRILIAERFDLHMGGLGDEHSFGKYFKDNKLDRHLSHDSVIPFWWVEPCALVTGDTGKLFMPAERGKVKSMPFAEVSEVLHPDVPKHRNGTLPPGVSATVITTPGGIRGSGYNYVLSGSYRPEDGLGFMEYTVLDEMGVHTTDAMFVEPGVTNAADRRWVTPHNPIPNPLEGYRPTPSAIKYTHYGMGRDPSISDWTNGKVESLLGYFRLTTKPGATNIRTHHYVPPISKRMTRWYDQRVDDPVRLIRVIGAKPLAAQLPAPAELQTPASNLATVPETQKPPEPPAQEALITAPLDPKTGTKPAVKTDAGGDASKQESGSA